MFLPQNARTPAAGHDVHFTSPTQNVTSPSNVTFYLLLVVTLSQRARLPLKRVPPLRIFPAAQTPAGYGFDCDCAYKGDTML